jgi:hypothetical protein
LTFCKAILPFCIDQIIKGNIDIKEQDKAIASSGRKTPPLAMVPVTTRLMSNAVVNSKQIHLINESDSPLGYPFPTRTEGALGGCFKFEICAILEK